MTADAAGFVLLGDAVPEALQEIRYYSAYNFVGERIDGYEEPAALLTRQAAAALKAVSDTLLPMGFCLKIYDAYRPVRAVSHFMRWADDPDDTRMQRFFYPDIPKTELVARGYIAARSSHSRGSTVDLTLVDMQTGQDADMGGKFDDFAAHSHFDAAGLTVRQRANRSLLRAVMTEQGFVPLAAEWWHFTLNAEPYPDTCFDFPVCRRSLYET